MKRDFTINILKELFYELKKNDYEFVTLEDSLNCNKEKIIIFRHDVDILTESTLKIAKIQHEIGIRGTYYFRILKCSYNSEIIKEIASLGHEIGYHYEDLSLAKGNEEKAYEQFKKNLDLFRKYYPVKTICMHGSPLSKWDNKLLWNKYSYKESGITAEPYFDLDFNEIFYITDTGRRWDGRISVRDKVNSKYRNKYKSTKEIISSVKRNTFPKKSLFTIHPQRWSDSVISWTSELIKQNLKNVVKKVIVRRNEY